MILGSRSALIFEDRGHSYLRKLLEIGALSVTHKTPERIVPSNFSVAFDIQVPRTRSTCVRVECLAGTPRVPVK